MCMDYLTTLFISYRWKYHVASYAVLQGCWSLQHSLHPYPLDHDQDSAIVHKTVLHIELVVIGRVPICIAPDDFWTCICTHENSLPHYCTLNCWQVEYLHTWSVVIFQPVYKIQSDLLPESNIDLEEKVVPSSCMILRILSLHHFGGPELFLSTQFWKTCAQWLMYTKKSEAVWIHKGFLYFALSSGLPIISM